MTRSRNFAFVMWLCGAALLAGCSKPESPKPDGTSGVRGVCLLPAEPPGEDGKAPERKPWAGVIVIAHQHNSPDGNYDRSFRAKADANGKFQIALNPGEYSLGLLDPDRLHGKMHTPMGLKVEPSQFTEVVLDYDKLNVRDLPKR